MHPVQSSATPLDAHLSSLLSLLLFLPLPTPLLADLINASFPRLWTHTALLRRTLWSPESVPPPRRPKSSSASSPSPLSVLRDLIPLPYDWLSLKSFGFSPSSSRVTKGGKPVSSAPPLTKTEKEFIKKRRMFLAVIAVGIIGWGAGTGAMPLPGKLGRLLGRRSAGGEEEGDWEEEEDEDEEGVELD